MKNIHIFLAEYLVKLKDNKRTDLYELIILMMLHDDFLPELNKLIKTNIDSIKSKKGKIDLKLQSSKRFETVLDKIFKNKYFNDNFSENELKKNRILSSKFICELILSSILHLDEFKEYGSKGMKLYFEFESLLYPTIEHKYSDDLSKIIMTFDTNTPLTDITNYLKNTLNIKNSKKTRYKDTIGKQYRMLMIEQDFKDGILKPTLKYNYIEQLICREMKKRYKEVVSEYNVNQSLRRIKKIEKDVNTLYRDK